MSGYASGPARRVPGVPVDLRPLWSRARLPAAEVGVALVFAAVLPLWTTSVDVDPTDRLGQVSGVAAVQLRLAVTAGLLLLAAHLLHRPRPETTGRLACAAAAGLASGAAAAGIVVALHGTPWPLFAVNGDAGRLAVWAAGREEVPDTYPPGMIWLTQAWAAVRGTSASFALHDLQIAGTALFGPVAYLSWRPLLPPVWALVAGTVTALPLIDPYKPLTHLTLLPLVPLLAALVLAVRRRRMPPRPCSSASGWASPPG